MDPKCATGGVQVALVPDNAIRIEPMEMKHFELGSLKLEIHDDKKAAGEAAARAAAQALKQLDLAEDALYACSFARSTDKSRPKEVSGRDLPGRGFWTLRPGLPGAGPTRCRPPT